MVNASEQSGRMINSKSGNSKPTADEELMLRQKTQAQISY